MNAIEHNNSSPSFFLPKKDWMRIGIPPGHVSCKFNKKSYIYFLFKIVCKKCDHFLILT